jgi:hypothetical protein
MIKMPPTGCRRTSSSVNLIRKRVVKIDGRLQRLSPPGSLGGGTRPLSEKEGMDESVMDKLGIEGPPVVAHPLKLSNDEPRFVNGTQAMLTQQIHEDTQSPFLV